MPLAVVGVMFHGRTPMLGSPLIDAEIVRIEHARCENAKQKLERAADFLGGSDTSLLGACSIFADRLASLPYDGRLRNFN